MFDGFKLAIPDISLRPVPMARCLMLTIVDGISVYPHLPLREATSSESQQANYQWGFRTQTCLIYHNTVTISYSFVKN